MQEEKKLPFVAMPATKAGLIIYWKAGSDVRALWKPAYNFQDDREKFSKLFQISQVFSLTNQKKIIQLKIFSKNSKVRKSGSFSGIVVEYSIDPLTLELYLTKFFRLT